MTISCMISGSSSSSKLGIFVLIMRMTAPTCACCTNTLTRKRPMRFRLMEKLHSLVASNSFVCRSFMIERTSTLLCSGVRGRSPTGVILPSTLSAGGKPAVMNRSEPLLLTMRLSRSMMSRAAWSRSISTLLLESSSEAVFVGGLRTRLVAVHDPALNEVRQTLVQRLHAGGLAGLDRRVHLRDLALADEIADRRGADHDLVRRHAAAAVFLQQGLGNDGPQRLGQHRAHHLLLGS